MDNLGSFEAVKLNIGPLSKVSCDSQMLPKPNQNLYLVCVIYTRIRKRRVCVMVKQLEIS